MTFPKVVETVDLMESFVSGGYSSVHTRLGFDTEIFTPKSLDDVKKTDEIVEKLRKLYGEKIKKLKEKNLQQKLYDSFKQEDLNSFHKPTYNIRLDGEDQSKKEGFFPKYLY